MPLLPTPDGADLNISREMINRLKSQAGRADALTGGQEYLVRHEPGGPQLSQTVRQQFLSEPAISVPAVNLGDEPIPPFSPVQIEGALEADASLLINSRTLSVSRPTVGATVLGIVRQELPVGAAGEVFISGACLVRLMRWFDSSVLTRADAIDDQAYLLASAQGRFEILWEEIREDAAIIDEEHWAIIRFSDQAPVLIWTNTGSETVSLGQPIIPNRTDDVTGITAEGAYSCKSPDEDVGELCYANLAGNVAAGASGTATPGMALVEVDDEVAAGDDIGPEDGETTFIKAAPGYKVMAYLGTREGRRYAVARPFCPRFINVEYINEIHDDTPSSVRLNGNLVYRNNDTDITYDLLLKFSRPCTRIRGFRWLWKWLAQAESNENYDDDLGVEVTVQLVRGDWDPWTVNWNIAAGLTLRESATLIHEFNGSGRPFADGEGNPLSGYRQLRVQQRALDGDWAGYDEELTWYDKTGYRLPPADIEAGLRIYGVRLAIEPVNYAEDAVAFGYVSKLLTGENYAIL